MRPKSLDGLALLYVDDSDTTALNMLRVFKRYGALAELVTTVTQAQEYVTRFPYSAIIKDHCLGGSERGTDLALWLQNHPRDLIRSLLRISYSGATLETILEGAQAHFMQCLPIRRCCKTSSPRCSNLPSNTQSCKQW
jgi:hypothetical protein